MWLGIASVALSACALCFCAYLYLELRGKLSEKDISSALERSSNAAISTLEKSYRSLETEWTDMYSKFQRIAGRIDKTRGIEATREMPAEPVPAAPLKRSDLIRNRNGRNHHVEALRAE